jgi:drug/metabolite transporter (DMT)-like permease
MIIPKTRTSPVPFLVGLLAFSLAGSSLISAKALAGSAGPFTLSLLSMLGGLVLLFPVAAARGELGVSGRAFRGCVLQALTGMALFRVCVVIGMAHVSAALAGIAMSAGPFLMAAVGFFIFRERPGRRDVLALGLVVAGTCIMRFRSSGGEIWGVVLLLVALAGETAMNALRKSTAADPIPSAANALYVTLWGMILMAPFAAVEVAVKGLPVFGTKQLAALAWYGVGPTALGYLAWSYSALRLSSRTLGIATAASPLAALALGALVLGERIGTVEAAGWTVAFCGVALAASRMVPMSGRQADAER